MSAVTYVVLAFAAYRAARAIALDDIALPFRERLYAFAWDDEHPVADGQQFVPTARAAWRTWLYALFTCPHCIGFWLAAGAYSAWRWWDTEAVHVVIVIFSIAGLQSFLQSRDEVNA